MARNENEWMQHMEELLNPNTRKEDVRRNLEGIKKYQSMEVRRSEWEEVILQIRDQ